MTTTELVQIPDGTLTPTGLALPENFYRGDFESLARGLAGASRAMQWAIGDLAAFGERKWGVSYDEIQRLTGYEYQTIANYAMVAKKVPISRRRENLSFSMHAEVAGMEDSDQERWLNEADLANYSVRELRAAIQRRTRPAEATVVLPGEVRQEVPYARGEPDRPLSAPVHPTRMETGERNEAMLEASRAARFPQPAPAALNTLPPIEAPELAIILPPDTHKKLWLLVQHFNSKNRRQHTLESFIEGLIEQTAVRTLPAQSR